MAVVLSMKATATSHPSRRSSIFHIRYNVIVTVSFLKELSKYLFILRVRKRCSFSASDDRKTQFKPFSCYSGTTSPWIYDSQLTLVLIYSGCLNKRRYKGWIMHKPVGFRLKMRFTRWYLTFFSLSSQDHSFISKSSLSHT